MKRRLMIARALMHSPRLLILDEPTAGVDIEIRRSMWDYLNELNESGTTIILTTHYLEEAENLCRHVAIIDEGNVIQHHPMDEFLRTLKQQNYIVNTRDPVVEVPVIDGCLIYQRKDYELELAVQRDHDLNDVFAALSEAGVRILSLRNKTNRLEELFFNLTDRSDQVPEEKAEMEE
jgi:ABC-2 type transport system ATP-binding protein